MKKLFVSFTALLISLNEGKTSEQDLAEGLFFFGCSRAHAFTPFANEETVPCVLRKNPGIHQKIVAALQAAEQEGRVAWRKERHESYQLLNNLLKANGFQSLEEDERPFVGNQYSYPGVSYRMKKSGIQLDVVY
jgi:hypothetical protein